MAPSDPPYRQEVRDLVVAVFRANGVITAYGDRLVDDLRLTASLWQVLDALERADGPLSVSDIARVMGLQRQSVQRSVDLLAERDLVAFVPNPSHKRAHHVRLTPGGEGALTEIHARERGSIKGVLGRLSGVDLAQAARVLATFAEELARQMKAGDEA